jgi:hypothetical protein
MSLSLPEAASSNHADFSMLSLARRIKRSLLKVSFFVSIGIGSSSRERVAGRSELPKNCTGKKIWK